MLHIVKQSSAELWNVGEAAVEIRTAIQSSSGDTWKLRGNFNGYHAPVELRSFLKWLLFRDAKETLTEFKVKETSRSVDIVSQQIVSSLKNEH